jgi:hypothetical protein
MLVAAAALCAAAADADVHASAGRAVVPCAAAISQASRPSSDRNVTRLVLGRVWLPKTSLVLDLSPPRPGEDRFGKYGIEVSAGPPVVLAVPRAWRRTYSLVFAPDGRPVRRVAGGASAVTVHSCAGLLGRWNAYAGGYELRSGTCIPLVVRVGSRSQRVRLSVGRRCATTG